MSHPDRKLAFLVFAVAAIVLAPGVWFGFPSSKAVTGGLRVLQGELPYRDFWTMYAPGQFFAIAGLYQAFGAELIVQGLATVGILAATAALLFSLLRRLGAERSAAFLVAALYVGLSWETRPELDSYPAALLLIVFGLANVDAHLRSGFARYAVIAGLRLVRRALRPGVRIDEYRVLWRRSEPEPTHARRTGKRRVSSGEPARLRERGFPPRKISAASRRSHAKRPLSHLFSQPANRPRCHPR